VTHRRRAHGGFTLVELMVVVTIIAIIGGLAARMYSGGVRGETAPAFARTLLATVADARHLAVALGKQARVQLVVDANGAEHLDTYSYDTVNGTKTWLLQGSLKVPSSLQLCGADTLPKIGSATVAPTCPISSATLNYICFAPNGHVSARSDGSCVASDMGGTTLYLKTASGDKKYRIVIWGLTGMAKVIDTW
jgi:prepilin-type N-terminal cleavage/methylation domain-containing protein